MARESPAQDREDRFLRSAARLRRRLRHLRRSRQLTRLAAAVTNQDGRRPPTVSLLTSDNDTLVAAATIAGRDVVIKIARSARAGEAVTRHATVLDDLRNTPGAAAISSLLPQPIHRGASYLIETRLPGSPLSEVGRPPTAPPAAAGEVACVFDVLHGGTARRVIADAPFLARTLDEPIGAIAALPGGARHAAALAALHGSLTDALRGQWLTVSWVHGDCWLGNVLAVRGAGRTRICGLIDWEDARPDGLPEVDLAHLWLTAQGGDLGRRLLGALADSGRGFEHWLAENAVSRPNQLLSANALLTLAWLGHVHAGLRHTPPAGPGRAWRRRTVDAVLPRLTAPLCPPLVESGLS